MFAFALSTGYHRSPISQCSILFEELLSLGDFSISEDLIHGTFPHVFHLSFYPSIRSLFSTIFGMMIKDDESEHFGNSFIAGCLCEDIRGICLTSIRKKADQSTNQPLPNARSFFFKLCARSSFAESLLCRFVIVLFQVNRYAARVVFTTSFCRKFVVRTKRKHCRLCQARCRRFSRSVRRSVGVQDTSTFSYRVPTLIVVATASPICRDRAENRRSIIFCVFSRVVRVFVSSRMYAVRSRDECNLVRVIELGSKTPVKPCNYLKLLNCVRILFFSRPWTTIVFGDSRCHRPSEIRTCTYTPT